MRAAVFCLAAVLLSNWRFLGEAAAAATGLGAG